MTVSTLSSFFGPTSWVVEVSALVAGAALLLQLQSLRQAVFGGTREQIDERPQRGQPDVFARCRQVLCQCIPEALALISLLSFALLLRLRGDPGTIVDSGVWEKIKEEWPLLMGADTLLGLQAMLRLLVFVAIAVRGGMAGVRGALCDDATALFFFAAATRAALSGRSQDYILDGPLGGDFAIACEAATVPVLAVLSLPILSKSPLRCGAMASFAVAVGNRNYLRLANDPTIDSLFTCAHTFEILGAFAQLASCVASHGTFSIRHATAGFVQLILPAQQFLAAYYFLTAFEPTPVLVGRGRPFCLLCAGNLLQLGAFVASSCLYHAESLEDGENPNRAIANEQPATGQPRLFSKPEELLPSIASIVF